MWIPIILLAGAALIASGSLFSHTRLFTYIATAMGLWQTAWLAITLIDRTLVADIAPGVVYTVGAIVLMIASIILARARRPIIPIGRARHDLVGDMQIIAVTCVVLVGAWVIIQANGFFDGSWVTHGFYNGDTTTFMALVQKSFDTTELVRENPFAQNLALEYPTLLHAGMAMLVSNTSGSWLFLLPSLTYGVIIMTIPLFFLVWRQYYPEDSHHWIVPISIIGLILSASWDSFVYPQSHFFLTGLFLLEAAIILQSHRERGGYRYVYDGIAMTIALVLLFSNAVTGTAAVALIGVHIVQRILAAQQTNVRIGYATTLAAFGLLYITATPGDGSLNGIGFSYTAAADMVRLTPLLVWLFAGIYMQRPKPAESIPAIATLTTFAFIAFLFSTRDIVVANASRFFYHALLIGFPLMATPLRHAARIVWETITDTSSTVVHRVSFACIALTGIGLLVTPSLSSVASAYDNLLFKDEQKVDTALRSALWWIEDNTAPDAVFLASPEAPFSIPAFTGRALLRSNYWLSPGDVVQEDVVQAFAGDIAARENVFGLADYILLTKIEREQFEPLPMSYEKVFDNNAVVIYRVPVSATTTQEL